MCIRPGIIIVDIDRPCITNFRFMRTAPAHLRQLIFGMHGDFSEVMSATIFPVCVENHVHALCTHRAWYVASPSNFLFLHQLYNTIMRKRTKIKRRAYDTLPTAPFRSLGEGGSQQSICPLCLAIFYKSFSGHNKVSCMIAACHGVSCLVLRSSLRSRERVGMHSGPRQKRRMLPVRPLATRLWRKRMTCMCAL